MDSKFDAAIIMVAVCVAAYAAIMLACIAHGFGLPGAQIRHLSMGAALFIALPVALDLLRTPPGKAG